MTFETMRTFFALLTLVANVAVVVAIVLAVGGRWFAGMASLRTKATAAVAGHEISLAFFVALTATLGSLYLSEIVHLIPCTYCWYQRIAMYPLVLLFGIAWIRKEPGIRHYVFPLAGIGLLIASYHYLIQRVPSLDGGTACSSSIPCTTAWFYEFGYMSIPYMAGSAFALILVLMITLHGQIRNG